MSRVSGSLGHKLLRAVLDNGDKHALRELTPELFLEEELSALRWVRLHSKRFGQLPSLETANANGHLLPEASEAVPYYLQRIRDRAIYNIINERQARFAEAMACQNMTDAIGVLKEMLVTAQTVKNPDEYITLATLGHRVMDDYLAAKVTPGLRGVTSGYETLDVQTSGFMPGDLIVIVARPGMGKTWLQLKMAHAAWMAGHSAAVVTMEMINEALVRRWVGVDTGINPSLIRSGRLSHHGERKFFQTVRGWQDKPPVHFLAGNFHKSVSSVDDMLAQFEPDVLYVDAGYLLAPSQQRRVDSATQLSKQVIDELKALAVSRKIPICITVQFNRNVRSRSQKGSRLDLADIGGTDAVGQNADIVLGLKMPHAPFSATHRIIESMKVREGEPMDFGTTFNFWPMGFDEVPLSEINDVANEGELPETTTDWML